MRNKLKITTAVLAASVALGSIAPATAQVRVPVPDGVGGVSTGTKVVGACIFGSAFGLIWAALAKGRAYNNDKIELTKSEAFGIAGTCGLYAFPVIASWRRGN